MNEREQFDAWFRDPKTPDNTQSYTFLPKYIPDIRRLLADVTWRAWQARAALAPPVAADGWQPIEAAPMDGTPILLARNEYADDSSFVAQGRWHEEDDDGPDNMGHDAGFMDDQFDYFRCARSFGNPAYQREGVQPTHWQHLPAPPTPA